MAMVSIVAPPSTVKREVVEIVVVVVSPTIANSVGVREPIAISPAARSVAEIAAFAITEVSVATIADVTSIAEIPIARIAVTEISVPAITDAVADVTSIAKITISHDAVAHALVGVTPIADVPLCILAGARHIAWLSDDAVVTLPRTIATVARLAHCIVVSSHSQEIAHLLIRGTPSLMFAASLVRSSQAVLNRPVTRQLAPRGALD